MHFTSKKADIHIWNKYCRGYFSSVESLSRVGLFATPMNHSMPGLPVHHQLLEFTQTHVHQVDDAIQPSHPSVVPFSSCPQSLPASEFFQSVNSSHQVAKVLELQLQHQSFQRTPRADLLQNGLVGSPCSPRDPQESSPTPQFKTINSSVLSFLHSPTLTYIHDHWKTHSLDQMDLCWQSNVSAFQYAIQIDLTFPPRSIVLVLVAQSCLTFCDPMDCSPPGSSVHGILQAKILEWVAISSSRGSKE